jgi:hypothetical protein
MKDSMTSRDIAMTYTFKAGLSRRQVARKFRVRIARVDRALRLALRRVKGVKRDLTGAISSSPRAPRGGPGREARMRVKR